MSTSSPILASARYRGHSADVSMHLLLEGKTLSVGQIGPDFIILDTAINHPPATGELFLSVDGNDRRWRVHFPGGMSTASRRVTIAKAH
jgi:hypothetical protein